MLTGQNGILNRAAEAKEKTETAGIDEQRKMAQAEALMSTGKTTYKGLTLPEGFAPTKIVGEDSIDDGLVITDGNGNEYVWVEVPKIATVYKTAGLNIVNFTTEEYKKIEDDLKEYTKEYNSEEYEDNAEIAGKYIEKEKYLELKNNMLKSIYINEGFWIGRYEAGYGNIYRTSSEVNNIEGIVPVSKIDQVPIIFVTRSDAEKIAENVESGSLKSSLLFGIQYKLTLTFLEENGTDISEIKETSINWGNYVSSTFKITRTTAKYGIELNTIDKNGFTKDSGSAIILTTGATSRNSKKNIYDLAGNVWEWTLGTVSSDSYNCVLRRRQLLEFKTFRC